MNNNINNNMKNIKIPKNSYLGLRKLSPLMDINRIPTDKSSVEVRTCNNLINEDTFITRDAKFADKLWDYFNGVRDEGGAPDYFHAEGINMILIGNDINTAYHLAAQVIPIGVEGMIYQNEDYYAYDGRDEMLEKGVSIGTLSSLAEEEDINDQVTHLKKTVDAVMVVNAREKENSIMSLNCRQGEKKLQSFDLPLLTKTMFTNSFIYYNSEAYDDFAKGRISEEDLVSKVMESDMIKTFVYEYGYDLLVVPSKDDYDYLELLREATENEKLTQEDLNKIRKAIGHQNLTEETMFNYLRFVMRDKVSL